MQPIRKNIDFKKYFSNEIKDIFAKMQKDILLEYPTNEITSNYFVCYALERKDTMLYKAVNGFLNTFTIEEIHDALLFEIQDKTYHIQDKTIGYSKEFISILSNSYNEKEKLNRDVITSDHVLLSILKNGNNKIKSEFNKHGLTYDILYDKSTILCDIADKITNINNDDKQNNIEKVINRVNKLETEKHIKRIIPFCKNLNELSNEGQIEKLIGRKKEINYIENVLLRKKNSNLLIVGKSGVGKTALIEGIVDLAEKKIATYYLNKFIYYKLNVNEIISGTSLRGSFEERVNRVFSELNKIQNSVLIIDDAHYLINDKKSDNYDILPLINEYIKYNNIRIILISDEKGLKKIINYSPSLKSSFQILRIEETSDEDTYDIIKGVKNTYEEYHNVYVSNEIIHDIIKIAKRYESDTLLPSSALNLLDDSCTICNIKQYNRLAKQDDLEEIYQLKKQKDKYIQLDNIKESNKVSKLIKSKEDKIKINISILNDRKEKQELKIEDILESISNRHNIPIKKLNISEKDKILNIDKDLKNKIIGQDNAIDKIANAIKRNKVGFSNINKPIFSGMLIGSSGTGKTLTAKILATELFGDDNHFIRFDMSEYSDKTSVNKLIGSNAGYIGYENGGVLTEAIKNKKNAVLLFDEIEKADKSVYNLMLQIIDDGFLTDNMGEKVDFKNTIILMTSNIGVKQASEYNQIGFIENNNCNRENIINKELKKHFPIEFLNRIDNIIYYKNFDDNDLKKIINRELHLLSKKAMSNNINLKWPTNVIDVIFKDINKDKNLGARPIVHYIQNNIEVKIADFILTHDDIKSIVINDKLQICGNE